LEGPPPLAVSWIFTRRLLTSVMSQVPPGGGRAQELVYQLFASGAVTAWSKVPLVVPSLLTSTVIPSPAVLSRQTTKRVTAFTVTAPMSSRSHHPESPLEASGPAASTLLMPVRVSKTLDDVPVQPVPP
jgi:hypothetical protein